MTRKIGLTSTTTRRSYLKFLPKWIPKLKKARMLTRWLSKQSLKTLKTDIKGLVRDIADFRGDYEKNGPMVEGISPK